MDRTLDWIASQRRRSDSTSFINAVTWTSTPATITTAAPKSLQVRQRNDSNSSTSAIGHAPMKLKDRRDSNTSIITVIHRPLFKPRKRRDSNASIITVIHSPLPLETTTRKPKPHHPPPSLLTLPLELREYILSYHFRPVCTCSQAGWDWHAVKENTWAYLGRHQPFDPEFPRNRQRSCLTHCLDILFVCRSIHYDAKEVFIREHIRNAGFLLDNILSARRLRSLQCFVGEGRRSIATELRVEILVPRRGTRGRRMVKAELDVALLVLNAYMHTNIEGSVMQEVRDEALFWQGLVAVERNGGRWWVYGHSMRGGRRELSIEGPLLQVEDWGGLGKLSVQALVDVLRGTLALTG